MKESDSMAQFISDREAISDVVRRWAYYKDRHMWDHLRTTFHPEGTIFSLWFDGPFEEFINASSKMSEKSGFTKHNMGVPLIELKENRAVSETDVIILVRKKVGGMDFDLTSYARFYDLLEKKEGVWRIARRVVIYEKDRIDTVWPSFLFWLNRLFNKSRNIPSAYRCLGAGLEKIGYELMPNIVTNDSNEAMLLYKEGEKWLSGA